MSTSSDDPGLGFISKHKEENIETDAGRIGVWLYIIFVAIPIILAAFVHLVLSG